MWLPSTRSEKLVDALDSSGEFEIGDLAPGDYDVVLRDRSSKSTVWRVEGVEVRGGEVARDPRLDPLDLREVVGVLELRIVDASGDPVLAGGIRVLDLSRREDAMTIPLKFWDGRVEIVHAGRGLDLEISAPGFLEETVRGIAQDWTVALRAPPLLRLVLAEGVRAPTGQEYVVLVLLPVAGSLHLDWPEQWIVAVGDDAPGEILAPRLGRMQVAIGVATYDAEAGEFSATSDVTLDAPWWIDVSAEPALQQFSIPVTQEQLEQALSKLRSEH